ncbi:MAG: chain-length determining protein [Bacteroidaceae bacterium]|nr:chain-length determining protein [Bacteroidaceae bacterium]
MEGQKNQKVIDLRKIGQLLWSRKKLFLKVWAITFVLACAWIFPQPRSYDTSVMLAPETVEGGASSTLSSIASSFGVNIGNATGSSDAIYPLLYPDVISSNDFIVGLFDIPVQTKDGEVQTDYLDYLIHHQKVSIWSYPKIWINQGINVLFPPEDNAPVGAKGKVDPSHLSRKEEMIVEAVRGNVRCSVDKKTDVITLSVSDQDPLVCATLADSVRARLQEFIIHYRTSKARIDVEYFSRMAQEAHQDYQKAVNAYSHYCDTHRDVILQSMQSQRDELENDMQMKFNTYNIMCTQLSAAQAKVQERTPAFTILQNASVPTKASSPKRMIFVAAMLFLATIVTGVIVSREYLKTFF